MLFSFAFLRMGAIIPHLQQRKWTSGEAFTTWKRVPQRVKATFSEVKSYWVKKLKWETQILTPNSVIFSSIFINYIEINVKIIQSIRYLNHLIFNSDLFIKFSFYIYFYLLQKLKCLLKYAFKVYTRIPLWLHC